MFIFSMYSGLRDTSPMRLNGDSKSKSSSSVHLQMSSFAFGSSSGFTPRASNCARASSALSAKMMWVLVVCNMGGASLMFYYLYYQH